MPSGRKSIFTKFPDYKTVGVDLYRQYARDLAAKSAGLERYVIAIFGPDLIGSIAFAIDPWAEFRNSRAIVTLLSDTANIRTHDIITKRFELRKEVWANDVKARDYTPNLDTPYLFDYYLTGPRFIPGTDTTINRTSQEAIHGFIKDSSKSKRKPGSDFNECEMFIPKWFSTPNSVNYRSQFNWVQTHLNPGLQDARRETFSRSRSYGPEIRLLKSSVDSLAAPCQVRALAAMQRHSLELVDRCLPTHKKYRSVYQIAELKDLAFTIRATARLWVQFERLVGRNVFVRLLSNRSLWNDQGIRTAYRTILGDVCHFVENPGKPLESAASAFLTFKFGWQSMQQAIQQFLKTPEKVSKQVNFLIRRMGQDTTFHSHKKWTETSDSLPTYEYNYNHFEGSFTSNVLANGTREVELRASINFKIQFPICDVPKLREELILRSWGLVPTPSDLYDLIPWSWLVDWFTGLGDYVHLMDEVNYDKSLFNYGFISYKEKNKITKQLSGKMPYAGQINLDGVVTNESHYVTQDHVGRFTLDYYLRKSLPEVAALKTYWDQVHLNPVQGAILGALWAAKVRFTSLSGRSGLIGS